jgi:hypothetical protein
VSNLYDIVGTEIEPGAYIFSSASSTAIAKFGYARYTERGTLMVDIKKQVGEVGGYSSSPVSSAAGTNVLVLATANGTIPGPVQDIW